ACGYGPIAAMVLAAKGLGARKAELLQYTTSGDVTGDRGQVVGYAAIAVM
ncbi:MAG: AmmeMemoRadiSam system protein B, partial [Methanomicrobiales archaeon]|nr:AmmeMemoRadiSam system protein B [Methanomicrobiales archaeon]